MEPSPLVPLVPASAWCPLSTQILIWHQSRSEPQPIQSPGRINIQYNNKQLATSLILCVGWENDTRFFLVQYLNIIYLFYFPFSATWTVQ